MRNTQLRPVEPETDESGRVPLTRILVVDDDPRLLRIVSKILTDEGHEVETVDNGRDALERIESRRYSLILTGIRMPYMNGFELYEHIQKIDRFLANRVIVISGDVMAEDAQEFLAKNDVPYLAKPFHAEQLSKYINRMLSRVK